MPYVHISVPNALSQAERHELCEAIGELMPLLPGKSRANTMMHIETGCFLEMGRDERPCLFAEVRLFKSSPEKDKQAFAKAFCALLSEKLDIKPERIYMNFIELDAWVSNGTYRV